MLAITKQFILDTNGNPIGVILPIEEYRGLVAYDSQKRPKEQQALLGALEHLGGSVASTEEIDATLKELWIAL